MAACLKPGGRLILTTPNIDSIPITAGDAGPFLKEETGWHVRKGYGPAELQDLCAAAGLQEPEISYCSGFLSQKMTWLLRTASAVHPLIRHVLVFPFRIIPPVFDPVLKCFFDWPPFSICMEARKPLSE